MQRASIPSAARQKPCTGHRPSSHSLLRKSDQSPLVPKYVQNNLQTTFQELSRIKSSNLATKPGIYSAWLSLSTSPLNKIFSPLSRNPGGGFATRAVIAPACPKQGTLGPARCRASSPSCLDVVILERRLEQRRDPAHGEWSKTISDPFGRVRASKPHQAPRHPHRPPLGAIPTSPRHAAVQTSVDSMSIRPVVSYEPARKTALRIIWSLRTVQSRSRHGDHSLEKLIKGRWITHIPQCLSGSRKGGSWCSQSTPFAKASREKTTSVPSHAPQ